MNELRLVISHNPFSERRTVRTVHRIYPTAGHLVQDQLPPGKWGVICDGRRLELDEAIPPDAHEVIVHLLPEFETLGAIIVSSIVSAAIGAGVQFLTNLLLGPPDAGGQVEGAGGVYSFGGLKLRIGEGHPIPIVYGEHRVAGQLIGAWRNTGPAEDVTERLFMLIALSEGPVQSIGGYTEEADDLRRPNDQVWAVPNSSGPLGAQTEWNLLRGGSNDMLTIDASPNYITVLGGSGDTVYEYDNYIGVENELPPLNCYAQILPVGSDLSGGGYGVAINLDDADNYHFARRNEEGAGADNKWFVGKKVAGVETILGEIDSIPELHSVRLYRNGDQLYVRAFDGVSFDETWGPFSADASLVARGVGLVSNATGGQGDVTRGTFELGVPATLPEGLQVNDIDANVLRDVRAWVRLGRADQGLLGDFSKVIRSHEVDIEITPTWSEYEFLDQAAGVQVMVHFPRGLYDGSGGSQSDYSVTVDIEYRDEGSGWTPIPGSPFTMTHNLAGPFSRTFFYEPDPPLSGEGQRLRIRRTNEAETVADARIGDACRLQLVNEVIGEDRQRYGNTALLAVQIVAQEGFTSSGTPNVTVPVEGVHVPVWDGVSGSADQPLLTSEFSRNPAWIALDVLTRRDRGLGNWISLQHVDIEAFRAWADWCGEVVEYHEYDPEYVYETTSTEAVIAGQTHIVVDDATDASAFPAGSYIRLELEGLNQVTQVTALGGDRFQLDLVHPATVDWPAASTLRKHELGALVSEPRASFDGVFDTEGSAWEALLRICRVGRAVPTRVGRRVGVRFEADDDPVQVITDSNLIDGSLQIDYLGQSEAVDIVEVNFLDRQSGYGRGVESAGDVPSSRIERAPVRKTVDLFGVTGRSHATREAEYLLRASRFIRRRLKAKMSVDGLAAESGDIVTFIVTLPQWSHWSGRANGSAQSVRLSSDVTLEPDQTYIIVLRRPDELSGLTATITSPPGDYAAGDIVETAAPTDPQLSDAPAAIYLASEAPRPFRLKRVHLTQDLEVELEAVEHVPAVYELGGWTLGSDQIDLISDPNECVPPGVYLVVWDYFICEAPETCLQPDDCCEFGGTYDVTVTGPAAACITVIDTTDSGVVIEIAEGCEGLEFCLNVHVQGSWGEPLNCEEGGPVQILKLCDEFNQECWTICA